MALEGSARVTPVRKALLALAALLVLVALAGIGATAAGWEPVGPADLPVGAYAPTVGGGPNLTTLDNGTFAVHGTTYEAELLGFEQMGGGAHVFTARIVRTGGDGGRLWPDSLTVDLGGQRAGAAFYGVPAAADRQPEVVGDSLQATVIAQPPQPGEGNATAELVLRTYREIGFGVWREDPLVLRFEFPYRVSGPGIP